MNTPSMEILIDILLSIPKLIVVLIVVGLPIYFALTKNTEALKHNEIQSPFRWGYYIAYGIKCIGALVGVLGFLLMTKPSAGIGLIIIGIISWFFGNALIARKKIAWVAYLIISALMVIFTPTVDTIAMAIDGLVLLVTAFYLVKRWDEFDSQLPDCEEPSELKEDRFSL